MWFSFFTAALKFLGTLLFRVDKFGRDTINRMSIQNLWIIDKIKDYKTTFTNKH